MVLMLFRVSFHPVKTIPIIHLDLRLDDIQNQGLSFLNSSSLPRFSPSSCPINPFDVLSLPPLQKIVVEDPILGVEGRHEDGQICQGARQIEEPGETSGRQLPSPCKDDEVVLEWPEERLNHQPLARLGSVRPRSNQDVWHATISSVPLVSQHLGLAKHLVDLGSMSAQNFNICD